MQAVNAKYIIAAPTLPEDQGLEKDKFGRRIFLAGSIEQEGEEKWQAKVGNALADDDTLVYDPRRDDWDETWAQRIDNYKFRTQVEWELKHLEDATHVVLYLSPGSISPISLLEFGLYAKSGKLLVCCPDGFDRKGNIDITCAYYKVPQFNTLDELIENLTH